MVLPVNLQDHPVQSNLYRAVFTNVASLPAPQQVIDSNVRFYQYRVQDIIAFISRQNPKGVTFQQLVQVPKANLSKIDRDILGFFTSDLKYFNQFARLHPDYDRLSADDFRVAARLNRNFTPLASTAPGDSFTPATPVDVSAATDTLSLGNAEIDELNSNIPIYNLPNSPLAVNKVPQTTVNSNVSVSATPLRPENPATPVNRNLSVNRGVNSDLSATILPGSVNVDNAARQEPSEAVKALVARNLVSEQVNRQQLVWRPQTMSEQRITAPDGIMRSVFHPDSPFEQVDYTESWRVSAHAMADLLQHIDPGGEVTLPALRAYKPRDNAEAAMLAYLRQLDVFKALAHLDAQHANTLDMDDIKVMMDKHMLVLSDAHLSVFVVD